MLFLVTTGSIGFALPALFSAKSDLAILAGVGLGIILIPWTYVTCIKIYGTVSKGEENETRTGGSDDPRTRGTHN